MPLLKILTDPQDFKFYAGGKGYVSTSNSFGQKSIPYSNDRPGGGNSGQPFIKNPIIDEPGKLTQSDNDFLLRGGIRAPLNAAEDVARLTKYLFNPKSPSGLLFTAKQNLLSRVSPKTEASKGFGYAGGGLNSGVYTPLSTLAQAGVGFLGTHLNKQGLDPTGLIDPLSINKYEDVINGYESTINFQNQNRLVALSLGEPDLNFNGVKGYNLFGGGNILEYGGGPGSQLGIGKTKIRFADKRTLGFNNLTSIPYYSEGGYKNRLHLRENLPNRLQTNVESSEITRLYNETNHFLGGRDISILNGIKPYTPEDPTTAYSLDFNNSSYKADSIYETSQHGKNRLTRSNSKITRNLYNEGKGSLVTPTDSPTYLTSLNQKYPNPSAKLSSEFAIEQRVKLGDPGRVEGTYATDVTKKEQVLDKINASTIYSTNSSRGKHHGDFNDLIAFRIGIIDPQNPSETTYMNFRAYIDSFSDSYGSSWKGQKYMGRAEEFYKYGGFNRDISLSFTIVAQSQGEMHGMYQKLNYLASSLAPTYTKEGYMAGNLSKLTVGDYVYEQTGFISSITYDIPQESSWELSLTPSIDIAGVGGSRTAANPDELPFMIKVTGLKFTPIHQFRPEIQPDPKKGIGERYITNRLDFTPNWTDQISAPPEVKKSTKPQPPPLPDPPPLPNPPPLPPRLNAPLI